MAEPLDRVKARAERFRHATEVAEADPGNGVTSYSLLAAAVLSAEDVPGLLAEVERLRALLGEDDGRHIVEFRADGWTIQHPLSCRPNLFLCPVNRVAEVQLDGPPAELGRYVCSREGGQFVIGEQING